MRSEPKYATFVKKLSYSKITNIKSKIYNSCANICVAIKSKIETFYAVELIKAEGDYLFPLQSLRKITTLI